METILNFITGLGGYTLLLFILAIIVYLNYRLAKRVYKKGKRMVRFAIRRSIRDGLKTVITFALVQLMAFISKWL